MFFVSDRVRTNTSGPSSLRLQALSSKPGLTLTPFCLLVALTPLAFAAPLLEPYIAAKEILIQAGAATLALLWLLTRRARAWKLTFTPTWIPLGGLTVIGATSIAWSSNPSTSLAQGLPLISYALLFAVGLSEMRRPEARALLATVLILAGAIEGLYVLLQYSLGDPIFLTARLPGKWQTFGTLGNPNWTGEFLAVAGLVSLGRLSELSNASTTQSSARNWTRLAFILILLALVATLARGAWLAFSIGTAAFMITRRHHINARRLFKSSVLPAVLISIAGLGVIALPLLSRQPAIDHLLNVKSLRGRMWLSAVTWTMIRDAPLRGHGLGTFSLQFPLYQARAFSQEWSTPFLANASFTSYAHNDYLQLWSELGIFGLLTFGALIWILLGRGRSFSADPISLGCWAAIISLLINSIVAFPLHLPTTLMLFVVLAAVVEAAACDRTVDISESSRPLRIVGVLLVLVLCISGYRSSYHLLVAESALWRADAALTSGRWNDAEESIRTSMQHAPTRIEPYAMLGRLYFERGEDQDALTALNQAMNLGFRVEVYELRASALERIGQREAAIGTLKELAWLRPDLDWPRERASFLNNANEENGR